MASSIGSSGKLTQSGLLYDDDGGDDHHKECPTPPVRLDRSAELVVLVVLILLVHFWVIGLFVLLPVKATALAKARLWSAALRLLRLLLLLLQTVSGQALTKVSEAARIVGLTLVTVVGLGHTRLKKWVC